MTSTTVQLPAPIELSIPQRNLAFGTIMLGMLLAATNSGTLIIALPDLERSLHTSLLALVWVLGASASAQDNKPESAGCRMRAPLACAVFRGKSGRG